MSNHAGIEPELQKVIEKLCNEGCKAVSLYIKEIEAGKLPEAMHSLSTTQKQVVLLELKSIMAVYDRCGD